jgi:hypothetical protein
MLTTQSMSEFWKCFAERGGDVDHAHLNTDFAALSRADRMVLARTNITCVTTVSIIPDDLLVTIRNLGATRFRSIRAVAPFNSRPLCPYAASRPCTYDIDFGDSVVGCAETRPVPWASRHAHSLVAGVPCGHRHLGASGAGRCLKDRQRPAPEA